MPPKKKAERVGRMKVANLENEMARHQNCFGSDENQEKLVAMLTKCHDKRPHVEDEDCVDNSEKQRITIRKREERIREKLIT